MFAVGFFLSIQNYFSYATQNERSIIVSILLKARSEAVDNVCFGPSCTNGMPHGVKIVYDAGTLEVQKYVLFQGASYVANDPLNQTIDANYPVYFSSAQNLYSEFSFSQLSGNVSMGNNTERIMSFEDKNGHSFTISINKEGRVSW